MKGTIQWDDAVAARQRSPGMPDERPTDATGKARGKAPRRRWLKIAGALLGLLLAVAALSFITGIGWLRPDAGQMGGVGPFEFPEAQASPPRLTVGEKLTFAGFSGLIPAGSVVLTVEAPEERGGRRGFRVVQRVRTSDVISAVYSVDDTLTSWIDTEDGRSLGYLLDQQESRRQLHEDVVLDYSSLKMKVHRVRTKNGAAKPWDYEESFPEGVRVVQDAVSVFYQLRASALEEGAEPLSFTMVTNRKFYLVRARVAGREPLTITLNGKPRTFETIKVNPQVIHQTDKPKSGTGTIWFDAETKVPLKFLVHTPYVTLTMTLQAAENTALDAPPDRSKE